MQNTEIDMKHRGLGPKGAKALSVALVVRCTDLKPYDIIDMRFLEQYECSKIKFE